jgi:hypothetical protein
MYRQQSVHLDEVIGGDQGRLILGTSVKLQLQFEHRPVLVSVHRSLSFHSL